MELKVKKFSLLIILLFATPMLLAQSTKKTNHEPEQTAKEIKILKQNFSGLILAAKDDKLSKTLKGLPKEKIVSDQVVTELMQRYPQQDSIIATFINTLQPEGNWMNIDYAGQSKSGWEPMVHAKRILELTKSYSSPKSSFYHSKDLANAIHKALDYWFKKKLVCTNWWYNEIGVPKTLGAVFILFENQLTPFEKAMAIELMNISKFRMTGQNKVWLAGNILIRGLLQNDLELIKQAKDTIVSEITVGRKEGIQIDNSYHQHHSQQQFGNYGAAFITDMSFWGKTFAGTSLEIEQPKLDILSNLINEGFQRILWKGYMDVNSLGRQYYKQAQRHKALSVAFSAKALSEIDLKNKAKYSSLLKNFYSSKLGKQELNGIYHFWKSDQTISRRPKWMTSVRMSSLRVVGGEAGNGDNLKGYYMSDGATYTYIDGDEYNNIFPVWDWRKLPGVTAYESDAPLKVLTFKGYMNKSYFVGNVSDGTTGLTSMELVRDKLTANKSWIFTDHYVLCLGAGINSDNENHVTTSIEQRLQKTDLLENEKLGWSKVEQKQISNPKDVRFFHDKMGYVILNGENLHVKEELRTGYWKDIMQVYPQEMKEEKKIISLWIDHGKKPQDASYQYILLPAATKKQTASFDIQSIQVISNTKEVQAVYLPKEKKIFITAYKPIEINLPLGNRFSCEQAGLYIVKLNSDKQDSEIISSDPTQQLKFMDFELNGKKRHVECR